MGDTNDTKDWLLCPACEEPALPPSGHSNSMSELPHPTWTEDDEADCPNCGVRVCARITGDVDGDYMTAVIGPGTCEDCNRPAECWRHDDDEGAYYCGKCCQHGSDEDYRTHPPPCVPIGYG